MRLLTIPAGLLLLAACGGGGSGGATSPTPLPPQQGITPVTEIQGDGAVSPLEGQTVTIRALVTGDFQENDADDLSNLGGFYVQDIPDGNLATSEGIFVFDGNNPAIDVSVGNTVEVQGTVNEYFGETQINATSVRVAGSGTLLPFPLRLPAQATVANSDGDIIANLEHLEGMLVTLPQELTVSEVRNLGRFGSLTLSQDGRLYQFTNGNTPDVAAYTAHKTSIAARSIVLDDGRRSSNPADPRYLGVRAGDTITSLTGNLRYSRGSGGDGAEAWRLMPTAAPAIASENPRPAAPAIDGAVRVASFNVLNFFSTIDTGQNNCGPQGNEACRGADSSEERNRQLAKIVAALALIDADIVGLIELENNASASLRMIVDALNARIGGGDYSFVDTGVIHDDVIKTGFIYKTSTIDLAGDFATLDRSVDSRFNDARNRPALAQSFATTDTGAMVTVVVNHLKSKGSSCESDGDPNTGDGQGNCNQTRTSAAAAIADWIATDPTGSNDPDVLIIGDLNAYLQEGPLKALKNAGMTNLLDASIDAYSFVFDGQAGALDHALASASLVPQVVVAMEWHINADEPALLDYNLEHGRDPALFDPDSPYRASDHDPVIVGLDLVN